MTDVFISYSRRDGAFVLELKARTLPRGRHGADQLQADTSGRILAFRSSDPSECARRVDLLRAAADLLTLACDAGGALNEEQWEEHVQDEPYRAMCSDRQN